jgi:signal-transduction protein with cAMP-binding, CBS, and nucleotidyltransferase domain
MTIGEVCNREVTIINRDASIVEAAEVMRKNHVGDLIVTVTRNDELHPIGIVTDRDLVIEVIAKKVDIDSITVGDVMSDDLLTAVETESPDDVMLKMRNKGVRRIPIVSEEGGLIGVMSVDDFIDLFAEKMEDMVRLISREQKRERKIREAG